MLPRFILSIAISISLASCSTLKSSTMLGIGIGGVVGAGMGAATGLPKGKESKGALTGAAIGAALGGLMGLLDFRERKSKAMKMQFGSRRFDKSKNPSLTKPSVRRVWIPEKIEGDRFINGHWIYVIDRKSVWRKN